MKKLIQGIVKFRRDVLPGYRETFAKLALGQSPDVLYISCSDSRVAVNVFASTDPGDLFVVRNVGNLVPAYNPLTASQSESMAAAIDFAVNNLKISDIIICGHSECGAMQALVAGREKIKSPGLREWLGHGDPSLIQLRAMPPAKQQLDLHNQLSKISVLNQIENLKTYPAVQTAMQAGKLNLHAWWFELSRADVYAYEEEIDQFLLIDEVEAARILERLK